MIITDIKKGKKRLNAVYIDGEFFNNIDSYILDISGFSVGSEVSGAELKLLESKSNNRRAYSKALYLLGFRDYSEKEMQNKLKLDFTDDAIENTIEKLKEQKLLDDEKFASKYADVLIFEKKFSKKMAVYELTKKGIDKQISESIVDNIDIDEKDQIKDLISRKYKDAYNNEKVKHRAIAFLQRHGYKIHDIFDVINNGDDGD